jgi:hypothetical protein
MGSSGRRLSTTAQSRSGSPPFRFAGRIHTVTIDVSRELVGDA